MQATGNSLKVGTPYRTCCGDMLQRQSFLVWHTRFCETVLLRGQNLASCCSMSCQNSAGLNSCIMKQGQNDLNFQCRIVCTALANCTRYNTFYASIRFVCTSLRTVPGTCVLCVHTKGLVPASGPSNMFPSTCRP